MKNEESHPSYGVIGWSRVQSPKTELFGSDLQHGELIKLTIHNATKARDLSRNWIFAKDTIAEVYLSSNQFAEFITSPNRGDGVPCTISRTQNEINIKYPGHELETKLHRGEFKNTVNKIKEKSDGIISKFNEMESSGSIKKKDFKTLKHMVEMMLQDYHANIPFVENSFNKAMEKTITAGKNEIEAYISRRINDAGLAAMGFENNAPQLLSKED